jgi:hypothetical protein
MKYIKKNKIKKTEYKDIDKKLFVLLNIYNEKSGCILTWEYFYGDEPKQWFLEYISDRDIWS